MQDIVLAVIDQLLANAAVAANVGTNIYRAPCRHRRSILPS